MEQGLAHEQLRNKRKELEEQLDEVGSGAGIAAIFVTSCVVVLGYLGLVTLLGLDNTLDHGIGEGIHITLICLLFIAGMVFPVVYLPRWLQWMYRRRYRRVWSWLMHSDASRYLVEQELWEEMFQIIEQQAWVRITGVALPHTLLEQLELASDYWPVIEAIVSGHRRNLQWRVIWGSLSRLSDTTVVILFNGCLVYLVMVLSGVLLFLPLIPLFLCLLPMYARRQGAQQAAVDWLLSEPAVWLSEDSLITEPAQAKRTSRSRKR